MVCDGSTRSWGRQSEEEECSKLGELWEMAGERRKVLVRDEEDVSWVGDLGSALGGSMILLGSNWVLQG